jgi:uncharacterized protein
MKPKPRKSAGEYFEEGIELFNQGRFFDCHESWEEVWKQAHGAEKLFYQGLIQAAVAILHAQRGNRDGARSLYAKARAKLDSIAPEHMGLAIGRLRDDLAEFFETALSEQARPRALPRPPRLHRASAQPRH